MTTSLDSPAVHAAVAVLRRDLIPGPYQPLGGWAHAIPTEKRNAIITVLNALRDAQMPAKADPTPPPPPTVTQDGIRDYERRDSL